jgi:hypothetical protein
MATGTPRRSPSQPPSADDHRSERGGSGVHENAPESSEGTCRPRNLIRVRYRGATPELVGRCLATTRALKLVELVSLRESNQPPELDRQMRASADCAY